MKIFRTFCTVIVISVSAVYSQVKVVEDSLFSSSINATVKCTIVLPDGYLKNSERHTVLYLLHGYSGDRTNWITLTHLTTYAKKYRFIIVTFDAKNSWYTNVNGPNALLYEDLLTKDIIPYIDRTYRTLQSKFGRAIAGLSMGGYGAGKYAIKYPSRFFFCGMLSPAIQFPSLLNDSAVIRTRTSALIQNVREVFGEVRSEQWRKNDIFELLDSVTTKSLPYFYICAGSQDGFKEIPRLTHELANKLRAKDISFEMHETAGGHDWKYWDKEIENILERIQKISEK
jgi:S-formylglutathione hydrolase FrmB